MALSVTPRRVGALLVLGATVALVIALSGSSPSEARATCGNLPVKGGSWSQRIENSEGRTAQYIAFETRCKAYGPRRRPRYGTVLYGFDGAVECSNDPDNFYDDGNFRHRLTVRPTFLIRRGGSREFRVRFREVRDPDRPEEYAEIDIEGRFLSRRGPAVGTATYLGPSPPPELGPIGRCSETFDFEAPLRSGGGGARP